MSGLPAARDPLATPYLDPALIERVVAMDDVLARNAAITRGYHELARAVAAIIGRDHANWLVFGQWARAEARRSMLGESVPAPLRRLLARPVAAAVAAGNAAVFGDVAPPFIRFVRAFADPGLAADPARAAAALAGLCADRQLAASEDLRRSFTAYVDAVGLGARIGPAKRTRPWRCDGRPGSSWPTPPSAPTSRSSPTRSSGRPCRGARSWRSRRRATSGSGSPTAFSSSTRRPAPGLPRRRPVPARARDPRRSRRDRPGGAVRPGPWLGGAQRCPRLGVVRGADGLHLHACPLVPARSRAVRPAARHARGGVPLTGLPERPFVRAQCPLTANRPAVHRRARGRLDRRARRDPRPGGAHRAQDEDQP